MSHKTTTKLRKLRGSMAQTTMEYQDPLGATFQAELRERRRRRRRRRGFSLEVCVRLGPHSITQLDQVERGWSRCIPSGSTGGVGAYLVVVPGGVGAYLVVVPGGVGAYLVVVGGEIGASVVGVPGGVLHT